MTTKQMRYQENSRCCKVTNTQKNRIQTTACCAPSPEHWSYKCPSTAVAQTWRGLSLMGHVLRLLSTIHTVLLPFLSSTFADRCTKETISIVVELVPGAPSQASRSSKRRSAPWNTRAQQTTEHFVSTHTHKSISGLRSEASVTAKSRCLP